MITVWKSYLNLRTFSSVFNSMHILYLLYHSCPPGLYDEISDFRFQINKVACAKLLLIRQVNEKSCRLRMGAYRDHVKRKGDKIVMGL